MGIVFAIIILAGGLAIISSGTRRDKPNSSGIFRQLAVETRSVDGNPVDDRAREQRILFRQTGPDMGDKFNVGQSRQLFIGVYRLQFCRNGTGIQWGDCEASRSRALKRVPRRRHCNQLGSELIGHMTKQSRNDIGRPATCVRA